MTNDTSTLNGALTELGETMASNLTTMGVTASASDGLTTLSSKILDISGGGGGTIELTSNKSSINVLDSETATLTANYSEGTGATLNIYINGTLKGTMTDNLDGTYSYTYTAVGTGTLLIYAKTGNTISNNLYLNDYLRGDLTSEETWHQINSYNSMTVTDGVATGYNQLTDYSWDNTKDWIFTCKYKANSASANGLIFADVTNTSNYDYNSFVILQNPNYDTLAISGHTGNSLWSATSTQVGSREYVDVTVINRDGWLIFYLNGTKYKTHENISAITDICVGMYSWQSGTGSFKDVRVSSPSDCNSLNTCISDAITYINGTGS